MQKIFAKAFTAVVMLVAGSTLGKKAIEEAKKEVKKKLA